MANPISNEIREKIVIHKQNKMRQSDIAKWLLISESTVTKVWSLFCRTGSWQPLPKNSGRKGLVSEEEMTKIINSIKERPDITINELIEKFDLKITESALCKRLIKAGLTYKKRHCTQTVKNEKTLS